MTVSELNAIVRRFKPDFISAGGVLAMYPITSSGVMRKMRPREAPKDVYFFSVKGDEPGASGISCYYDTLPDDPDMEIEMYHEQTGKTFPIHEGSIVILLRKDRKTCLMIGRDINNMRVEVSLASDHRGQGSIFQGLVL